MRIVIDACTIINLFNADALCAVCQIDGVEILVGPIVLSECGPECAAQVLALKHNGQLDFVDDDNIPVDRFLELVAAHDIGDGEIESIAICEQTEYLFCSDDGQARRLAVRLLGDARVMGGLRLLKMGVLNGVLACEAAYDRYLLMKQRGGFLPVVQHEYFCDGQPVC